MLGLGCPSALAQNLRDVPLGGRTATMGGAGVAAGADSAMPYLNPAGVGGTPYDLFSLSASAYAYSRASVRRFFRSGGFDPALGGVSVQEERFEIDQFVIIPASAGYFMRFGAPDAPLQHVVALSAIATAYNDYRIDGTFRATSSVGRLEEDFISTESFRQVFGGPSYAVAIGDRVRLGASLFASYTTLEVDAHDLALLSIDVGGVQVPSTLNSRAMVDAFSFGLTGIAGVQVRAVSDLWFGAALGRDQNQRRREAPRDGGDGARKIAALMRGLTWDLRAPASGRRLLLRARSPRPDAPGRAVRAGCESSVGSASVRRARSARPPAFRRPRCRRVPVQDRSSRSRPRAAC